MAVAIVDSALCIWNHLKTSTDLATLRGMVVSGADGIYEAGDLTAVILSREVAQRRTDATPTKILAISVQDAGERSGRRYESIPEQTVRIRLLDRDKGYRNIRTVREELIDRLKPNNFRANVELGHELGVVTISFAGRTGHMKSRESAVDYEVLTYQLTVVRKEN